MPDILRSFIATLIALAAIANIGAAQAPDAAGDPTAAITALKKLGARITFDDRQRVVGVNLSERKADDADLVHLRALPDVTELDLTRTRVAGPGLAHLVGLKSLRVLYLTDTKVDDVGIAHLAPLKSLEFLGVSGTKITDAAFLTLKDLPKLGKLFCLGTKVTPAGIADFQRALPDCLITD